MTRSPLFYPMHRGDADAGGAADLQTDIMRFMAILALCLVAIFALVQSIPLIPEAPAQSPVTAAPPPFQEAEPVAKEPVEQEPVVTQPTAVEEPAKSVLLTRPKWTSRRSAVSRPTTEAPSREEERLPVKTAAPPTPAPPPPTSVSDPTEKGFSLRFESDHALTRLVAAGKVGLYALGEGRAQRMTVSESRISFWDASTPSAFHEMETSTVPRPVIDALARSGINTAGINWGVTLPGKLREQLDALMRDHSGGALIIGLDGELRLEAS